MRLMSLKGTATAVIVICLSLLLYLSIADGGTESEQRLVNSLEKRFPVVRAPLSVRKPSGQPTIHLLSAIRKKLPFEVFLDRFNQPLLFQQTSGAVTVKSFGFDPAGIGLRSEAATQQATVVDDQGDENVIIRLDSHGPQRDRIILAMIPPGATLEDTWQDVVDRTKSPNPKHNRSYLSGHETLQIPVLNLSVRRRYSELEIGINVSTSPFDWRIERAVQDIQFRLDETGADFMSVSELVVIGEFGDEPKPYNPDRVRRFVFDRPFLVALQEPAAPHPYFIAWIADAELMEEFAER